MSMNYQDDVKLLRDGDILDEYLHAPVQRPGTCDGYSGPGGS